MTTGRINQVTTFQFTKYSVASHLSWQEFVSLIQNLLNLPVFTTKRSKNHLVPRSHIIQDAMLLVVRHDKNHALLRELPAISKNARSRRILKCPIRNKTGPKQAVHIFPLPHCEHMITCSTLKNNHWAQDSPFQISITCYFTASLIQHRASQPTPSQNTKAYSDQKRYFNLCRLHAVVSHAT